MLHWLCLLAFTDYELRLIEAEALTAKRDIPLEVLRTLSRAEVNSQIIGIDQLNSGIAAGIGIERSGTKLIELKDLELNWN